MPPGPDEKAHLEPPENRRDLASVRASEERWRLLARAGTILASSLDLSETLASLARTMVPDLADFCVLFLMDETGKLRPHAVAHAEHGGEARLWELATAYRPEDVPDSLLLRVVARGEPVLVGNVQAEAGKHDCYEVARAFAGELLPDSVVVAPLTARGRALGVVILATQGSGRRYGLGDDSFVNELARRAGLAVDNARLYGE
ncbi:MAG: GAF domain-containing protein, partial [Acidobacteriota bacterium]